MQPKSVLFCQTGRKRHKARNRQLIMGASPPMPAEPIPPWMAHLTPFSRRGPQDTSPIHIKALGSASTARILSCLFGGSQSVDPATVYRCIYVGLLFQVKLSLESNSNLERRRQGSSLAEVLPAVLSHHSAVRQAHIMNPVTATTAPISPQHSMHIDFSFRVHACACM